MTIEPFIRGFKRGLESLNKAAARRFTRREIMEASVPPKRFGPEVESAGRRPPSSGEGGGQ